jgi:hypothetical protein
MQQRRLTDSDAPQSNPGRGFEIMKMARGLRSIETDPIGTLAHR